MANSAKFLFLPAVNTSGPDAKASVAPPTLEPAGGICPAWLNTNHILFQIANLFLLLSYVTPGGPYTLLYLRVVIGLGSFFYALWGYVILCAFDTLLWNALFALINLVHIIVLVRGLQPVSFSAELETVFEDLFRPLGVTRHQFRGIADSVRGTRDLSKRDQLVVEKVSRNDNLSLVVSGDLLVSRKRRPVEMVGKYEFLESSDWFDVPESDLYQVTATALGACRVVVWKRETLKVAVGDDPFLKSVFNNLVGKDLARKFYAAKKSRQFGVVLDELLSPVSSSSSSS
ncbi:blood vessel epicardial substance-A-like [Ixodes scapularis]|uniref:blood vessel epicardial substance-A-like n=1 Tax=Ixodes scapularis TaxID=6945 RepID=UPI001C3817C0|nr:blood vessel epicardial substance-A-like [Ixodes scapularis]